MTGNVGLPGVSKEALKALGKMEAKYRVKEGVTEVRQGDNHYDYVEPSNAVHSSPDFKGFFGIGDWKVMYWVNEQTLGNKVSTKGVTVSFAPQLTDTAAGDIYFMFAGAQGVTEKNMFAGFKACEDGYKAVARYSSTAGGIQYIDDTIYTEAVVTVFIKKNTFEVYINGKKMYTREVDFDLGTRWYYFFYNEVPAVEGDGPIELVSMAVYETKFYEGYAINETLITLGQVQNKVTLPEDDRDENDLYCVLDGELWYNDFRQNQSHANIVDGLPPSGDVLTEDMDSITIYYNIRDEKVWCWLNDEMAAMMGGEEGWYEAEAVLDAMHEAGLTDIEWAGVCDYRLRHTVDDKMRMIIVARYFRFLNGQWVTLSEGIGYPGEAQGAEKFNYINNNATGLRSHAEGWGTSAAGECSHAEGYNTEANGLYSHAEGNTTFANGNLSHAECYNTKANGNFSHAEGCNTEANGESSHAEGWGTDAAGEASHAEGKSDHTRGDYVTNTVLAAAVTAANKTTRSDSDITKIQSIIDTWDHQSEGDADQKFSVAAGAFSHAEGANALVIAKGAHAEGNGCVAAGKASHAEGTGARATGHYSHAGGLETMASADYSFAHGYRVMATGKAAVAIGYNTHDPYTEPNASATGAIAIGRDAKADAFGAIAIGSQVKANRENQVVVGVHNDQSSTAKFVIGNGTGTNAKSNSFEVDADGNVWCSGSLEAADGLILKAPNGTKYKITVANDGTLETTALT